MANEITKEFMDVSISSMLNEGEKLGAPFYCALVKYNNKTNLDDCFIDFSDRDLLIAVPKKNINVAQIVTKSIVGGAVGGLLGGLAVAGVDAAIKKSQDGKEKVINAEDVYKVRQRIPLSDIKEAKVKKSFLLPSWKASITTKDGNVIKFTMSKKLMFNNFNDQDKNVSAFIEMVTAHWGV